MKKSFFLKNLILFLVPSIIPIVIFSSLSIVTMQSHVRGEISKNNFVLLEQIKENMELIFDELNALNVKFSTSVEVINTLKNISNFEEIGYETSISYGNIINSLNASKSPRIYIDSIYIYIENNEGRFLTTGQGMNNLNGATDKSWYESYYKHRAMNNMWTELRNIKKYEFEKQQTKVITVFKKLFLENGVIILNISYDYIVNKLNSLVSNPEQSILIVDNEGKVILDNNSKDYVERIDIKNITNNYSDFFDIKIDNESYVVSKVHSSQYDWFYISITPRSLLYSLSNALKIIMIQLLFISLVLAISLTYYLTRKNFNNVTNIISIIQSAEKGLTLPNIPPTNKSEYDYIIQNIIRTFIQQRYLTTQLSERKYKMKVMELLAMQSQINPHFLFNTLKTIYWKSIGAIGENNELSKMIENLSEILYFSLGNPDKLIAVGDEVKYTQSYIDIQKVRYKDKFDFIWEYEDEVLEYKLIKLLIQPLIENSIYHGIKNKEGNSTIKVKIHKVENCLKISVIDNGIGMTQNRIDEVEKKLKEEGEFSAHIGLFNVNKRIQLTYGDEYSIKLKSKYGLGTAVYISIPIC